MERTLILICLLIASLISVGVYYWDYPLPLHSDSWDNIAVANAIIKAQKVIFHNPCLPGKTYYDIVGNVYEKEPEIPTNRWELGFDLFIAIVHLLTKVELIDLGVILPFFFCFLMSLGTFSFMRNSINEQAAFFSALFVLTYQTNVISLGPAFLVALSFGFMLIPNLYYLFSKIESFKQYFAFSIVFLMLMVSHPSSALLVFFVCGIGLMWRKNLRKNFLFVWVCFIAIGMLYLMPKIDFNTLNTFITQIQFKRTTVQMNIAFKYSDLIGMPSVLLGVLGIWYAIREKPFPLLCLLVPAIISFIYIQTGTAYFIPYDRSIGYAAQAMLMLSGVGAFLIEKHIKKIGILIAILVLGMQFIHIYNSNHLIYKNILPEEKEVLFEMRKIPLNSTVISRAYIGEGICAVSGKKVVALERGRIGSTYENIWDVLVFFNSDCKTKKAIIDKYNATHVYSREKIDCNFLKRIKTSTGWLYEVVD